MLNKTIYIAASLLITGTTYAGLNGETFHLTSEATDSPLLPGGQFDDLGNFVVGNGIEWSQMYPVYDYQQLGAPIIGEYTYTLDIGDDYIETSASWTIYVNPGSKNPYSSYFSLLPCAFYGFHLNFDNPTNLSQNQQLQVTSNNAPVGQMGDLNLFANIDPALEQWVDAQAVAPESPTRITVGESTLDLNLQGTAWGWFETFQGVIYTETSRIDLDFNCVADTTGDGIVNVADILQLIGAWGPCAGCNEDINNDGSVDVADLLDLIAAWGACP